MATSPLISLLLEIENTLKVFPQPDYEDIPIELLVALDELTKATRGALNLLDGNIDAKDADAQVHELDIKALISGDVIAFIIGDINGKHHVVTVAGIGYRNKFILGRRSPSLHHSCDCPSLQE